MRAFCRSIAVLAGLAGGVGMMAPAVADDGPGPAYVDQSYYPAIWQGIYAGVHLGWGWSGDASGGVGGGQIGYNWQSRQFVYGIEGDISAADIGISETFVVPGAVLSASASIDWITTLRGRFGILLKPNLLLYGTAGLAIVHAEANGSVNGFVLEQTTATGTGLVHGIGIESMLTDRMSARFEYLGFSQPDRIGDFGVVRAGLNFRFGP